MIVFKDYTPQILKELQKKQLSFVSQGGQIMASKMKDLCPVDQGNLKNSITSDVYVKDAQTVSENGPHSDYAVYVEYGTGVHAVNGDGRKTPWRYKDEVTGKIIFTHGSRAQPFAEPGFQNSKPPIDILAKKVLKV
jgi:HK97 gp10 family phage protein